PSFPKCGNEPPVPPMTPARRNESVESKWRLIVLVFERSLLGGAGRVEFPFSRRRANGVRSHQCLGFERILPWNLFRVGQCVVSKQAGMESRLPQRRFKPLRLKRGSGYA